MSELKAGSGEMREIRSALAGTLRIFVAFGLLSAFVILLMLTGPEFMLQAYDRVLSSRSETTQLALIGIVAFFCLMMGFLDNFRARCCPGPALFRCRPANSAGNRRTGRAVCAGEYAPAARSRRARTMGMRACHAAAHQ